MKTFEDALNELGEHNQLVAAYRCHKDMADDDKDLVAYLKLRIIAAALNEGWKPKLASDEYLWYPLFKLWEKEKLEDTTTYTVKIGDTLYKIAERYNTTVSEIMALNNLKTSILSIGQVLKIPQGSTTAPSTKDYVEYVVKSGDNLYSIANRYGTTVSAIKSLSNLTE